MSIKVSIIIPVYNKEKYIENCINSILSGDLYDIEVIAVDDGSNDNSVNVIKSMQSKESRIKLLTKENGGSSSARNMGIKYAMGEYILFVDADDYLEQKSIKKLYNKAKNNNLDVVVFDIIKDYDNKSEKWGDFCLGDNESATGYDYINKYLLNCCIPSACNKLWKRTLFADNNIYFPEDIDFGEDGATVPRLMLNAGSVGKINEGIYHYKIHESSKIFNNDSKVHEYLDSYNLVMDYLESNNFKCSKSLKFTYKYTYVYKMLEEINTLGNKIKSQDYNKLYENFLLDIKDSESKLIKVENDEFFNIKSFFRSNFMIKCYKLNRILGDISKIIFIFMKKVVRIIR